MKAIINAVGKAGVGCGEIVGFSVRAGLDEGVGEVASNDFSGENRSI